MYWPDSLTRQRLPPPRCGSDGAETWLRRAVGIAHTALQSRKPRLVVDVEEEQHAHGRLPPCELDCLSVEGGLGLGTDRRHELQAGVERRLVGRDARLDAVLPVDDGHVRAGLAGAVERRGEDVDELLVVGNADRGRARVR